MDPESATTIDLETSASRQALASLVTRLFDCWELDTASQLNLLGLSESSHTQLFQYRRGEPLSTSGDMLDRVGRLLAIHKALRLLFPGNPELRNQWIKRRNRAFANLTPLEEMTEHGLIGIAKVSRYLDEQRCR